MNELFFFFTHVLYLVINSKYCFEFMFLETRDSNPYSLDPKSNALPVKLVSNYHNESAIGGYFCKVRVKKNSCFEL